MANFAFGFYLVLKLLWRSFPSGFLTRLKFGSHLHLFKIVIITKVVFCLAVLGHYVVFLRFTRLVSTGDFEIGSLVCIVYVSDLNTCFGLRHLWIELDRHV